MANRKWVVAGNREQFVQWCQGVGINPRDREQAVYISHPDAVRGHAIDPKDVEYVGNCYQRPDLGLIMRNLDIAARGVKHE